MRRFLRALLRQLNEWAITHLCKNSYEVAEFLPVAWREKQGVIVAAPPDISLSVISVHWMELPTTAGDGYEAYFTEVRGDAP